MAGTPMTSSTTARIDAALCRLSDRLLRGPCPPAALVSLSVLDAILLAALAYAMATLGSWVATALACVLFASRAPSVLARIRADAAALSRPAAAGRARAARGGEAGRRLGSLALLAMFLGLALVVAVAYALDDEVGPQVAAFGIDPEALTAWRLAALPASTGAEILRLYAGCALSRTVSSGRSRPGALP